MKSEIFDFVIIGAGIVGCNIAYELSKYKVKILVVEKNKEVGLEASSLNSGVIHSGYAAPFGTLKASLNVKAVESLPLLAKELNIPYKKTGKLLIARGLEEINRLEDIFSKAKRNGVKNIKRIRKDQIKDIEPLIDKGVEAALYFKDAGIISTEIHIISLAENAHANGAMFLFNSKVSAINRGKNSIFNIYLNGGLAILTARCVINCAGLYSDEISGLVGAKHERIYPQKGQYYVLRGNGCMFNTLIYPVPPLKGSGYLGTHITPTIEGYVLIGPSGEFIKDKEDKSTNPEMLRSMLNEAMAWSSSIDESAVASQYAGIRAKITGPGASEVRDFIIEEDKKVKNFINITGIDSPGLTCANEIAKYALNSIRDSFALEPNREFSTIANDSICMREFLRSVSELAKRPFLDNIKKDIRMLLEKNRSKLCNLRHAVREEMSKRGNNGF